MFAKESYLRRVFEREMATAELEPEAQVGNRAQSRMLSHVSWAPYFIATSWD